MYEKFSHRIIQLRDEDVRATQKIAAAGALGPGYHPLLERLHGEHADALAAIIDEVGYPTPSLVGEEASEAAWLIVQHALPRPDFMRRCRELLADAVARGEGDAVELAYLTDRIAVFEGRPQLYGTQFDWDMLGQMSPQPYDNIDRVNERRRALGMNSLEARTAEMRRRTRERGDRRPENIEGRAREKKEWRERVGW